MRFTSKAKSQCLPNKGQVLRVKRIIVHSNILACGGNMSTMEHQKNIQSE